MRYKQSLCHTRANCKDHNAWIPQYRQKVLSGRRDWGE